MVAKLSLKNIPACAVTISPGSRQVHLLWPFVKRKVQTKLKCGQSILSLELSEVNMVNLVY